jgi:hypothetical protein
MRIALSALLTVSLFFVAAAQPCRGGAVSVGLTVERLKDPNVVRCPVCNKAIVAGRIHENAETILSTEVGGYLDDKGIDHSGGPGAVRTINVLVYRFQERRGGNLAVEKPASVAFHVHLMKENKVLKVFSFDETQQALSDNVLRLGDFVRRGGKWVTAGELAREGVHRAIDGLSDDIIQSK